MSVLDKVEPTLLWKHFDALRKIPRASGKETAAAQWVQSVAAALGLESQTDETGNVLVRKPATPGHENADVIVLQSHLDMVCEKNSDKEFDFDKDAIQLVRDGDWLTADGTTLGADNGIGIAAILAILEDSSLTHGPLECLFTVDEERGLNGAMSVSPDWLRGRTLLNLDSEEIGVFSIGCAGGRDTNLSLPISRTSPEGDATLSLHLAGLRGGHSGIDIHEGRGNAVKMLSRLLYKLNKIMPIQLAQFRGGDKHNAIPREAFAEIVVDSAKTAELKKWIDAAVKEINVEYHPVEKDVTCTIKTISEPSFRPLSKENQVKFFATIATLPHGVLEMSRTIKNLVETSNNVAAVHSLEDSIKILTSSRSSNMNSLQDVLDSIVGIAWLAGADYEQPNGYPGWMPNLDSPVLKVSLDAYKQVAGEEAQFKAIHAGLECGLIGEKFPDMDMISFGPTIQHPHSPDERVHIGTVQTFYEHVRKLLQAMA